MNRLVIIGNGFDIAHGLPTKYKDFIDDYWSNINKTYYKDELIELNIDEIGSYEGIKNYSELIDKLNTHFKPYGEKWIVKFDGFEFFLHKPLGNNTSVTSLLKFKNNFFRIVCNNSVENWVDIENLYYNELKKIVKLKPRDILTTEENQLKEKRNQVESLNNEFNSIKNLFEKYLHDKIENQFEIFKKTKGENDWTKFYQILKPISIFNNEHNLKLEFNDKDDKNEIDIFYIKEQQNSDLNKTKICLLNFNYTSTLNKYITSLKEGEINVEQIQIHGAIYDKMNKINFGFGDEMDDDYKIIENINENEYLRNFKSFQYLQNSNYSNLLSFIDSDKFQVLIMGHSCGLSDRTLLNTIFEHNNCRSIKVFFYEIKNDKGEVIKDNYTEITQNISRHFNKKKLMREKIVNKTLCQPLPQIQLPKKG